MHIFIHEQPSTHPFNGLSRAIMAFQIAAPETVIHRRNLTGFHKASQAVACDHAHQPPRVAYVGVFYLQQTERQVNLRQLRCMSYLERGFQRGGEREGTVERMKTRNFFVNSISL